ncbi:hypothetical protein B0H10DRAFT_2052682 [Mycena sp. CBHHK59/15]|nr:hypothetical protein B0H10DRAFT_2052682 [Mycena sp. CBHHK59/15]
MLTVMGVVIGFVISYRAMTGYDRYWMGRTAWTDVIRNARTMGRLIWYHVPPRLTPFVAGDLSKPGVEEMSKVMAEKRMALDLTEAFAVALKHHLRGELGIYYEDLYDLIKPLHDFEHGTAPTVASAAPPLVSSPTDSTATSAPTPPTAAGTYGTFPTASSASTSTSASSTSTATLKPTSHASKRPSPTPAQSTTATATEPAPAPSASTTSLRRPLLPASNPTHEGGALLGRVAPEMIAFAGVFTSLARFFAEFRHAKHEGGEGGVKGKVKKLKNKVKHATHTWAGPIHAEADLAEYEKGENLPEEVLRVLSEWVSVLEVRGSVPGASLGNILAGIQQFEMSLTCAVPLPLFVSLCFVGCFSRRALFSIRCDSPTHPGLPFQSGYLPDARASFPAVRPVCACIPNIHAFFHVPCFFIRTRLSHMRTARAELPFFPFPSFSYVSSFISCILFFPPRYPNADSDLPHAVLEHILTTPLPFVYSVHIRVVWLYLFLLPLQLVSDFGWHTVPAVSVGAFVYLGFVAAGEEIEQPFGLYFLRISGSDLLRGDCSDFTSHHARLLRRQRPRPRHVLPRHHPAGRAGAQGRAVPQCVPPRLAFLYIHSFCYFDKFHVCTRRGERERAATPHIDGEPRGGGGARRGCWRGSSGERGQ